MADAAVAFPDWIDGAEWDTCMLGQVFLPGVVTIENLEIGRDVDVQKRRKKEKARLRDNGLSPVTFDIICEFTSKEWPQWLAVLPNIQPKEGGTRTPLAITHPMVNTYGVKNVYIHKIKLPAPSARKGMRIEIHCGEWFEEEVEAKGPSKKTPASLVPAYQRPDYFGDPTQLAKTLQHNEGYPDVTDSNNVMANSFGADPPNDKLPGEAGWHGFRGNSAAKKK